jgi:hypothetical protein
MSGFTERPLGLDAAEWDARNRELARLMRAIQEILPHKMGTQDKAAFEMALTMHLGGV